jgi:hypothetical protein
MGLRDDELASIRATVGQFLPDQCTIVRTGAVTNCRVNADTRELHLDSLPRFAPLQRWRITFASTTAVLPGDVVVVVNKGTYLVTISTTSQALTSFSVQTVAFALAADLTVTFERYGSTGLLVGHTDAVPVVIEQIGEDEQVTSIDTRATYRVTFPFSTSIDGTPVGRGDWIIWDRLRKGRAQLRLTTPPYNGAGLLHAQFAEQG